MSDPAFEAALARVVTLLREQCASKVEGRSVAASTSMRDDLGLDSLDLLALVAEIENQRGHSMEDATDEVFDTVGSLARYLVEEGAPESDRAS